MFKCNNILFGRWWLLTFFLLLGIGLQGQELQWVRGVGSIGGHVYGTAIATDDDGNIYSAGRFTNTVDFDPGIDTVWRSAPNNYDAYVMKMDSIGKLLWVRTFGSTSDESVTSIVVDHHNNVIISGDFNGTVDFDPGPGFAYRTAGSTKNIFQWKADANGNFLRVFHYYSPSQVSTGLSLTIDDDKNLIMSGTFTGTIDFDPGPGTSNLTSSYRDAFIQKLDSNDNFVWAAKIGGTATQSGNACKTDSSGNVYVTGSFSGTTDFDPGAGTYALSSPSIKNAFLLKLTSTGSFDWVRRFGTSASSNLDGKAIEVGRSGNVYFGGYFTESVDFDPGAGTDTLSNVGGNDFFIAAFDSLGNHRWAHGFGDTLTDQLLGMAIDSAENIFTVGRFIGTIDFDPSSNGVASLTGGLTTYSAFIDVLDSAGQYVWASHLTGSNWVEANAICIAKNGHQLVTGRFSNEPDFDPSPATWVLPRTANANRAFIYDLGPCDASQSILVQYACDSLTYNGQTYFNSGTHYQTIPNYAGCDSFIELEIRMRQASYSTVTLDTCAPFIFNGVVFNSTGTYQIVLNNANGCDSVLTANLTLRQDAQTTFADTACSSYSWNGITYNSSGSYQQYFPAANGCDSIVTMQLVLNETRNVHTINSCEPVTYGGQLYTSSFYSENHYTNIWGCDSVEILNLNIIPIDTGLSFNGTSFTAAMAGGAYSWIDCGNNNAEILGENGRIFIPSQPGSYAVIVSNGVCTDTSECLDFTIVDLLLAEANIIQCLPNPSHGVLNIVVPESLQSYRLQLFDAYGKRIFEREIADSPTLKLNLPTSPGIYFLTVLSEGISKTFKVLRL